MPLPSSRPAPNTDQTAIQKLVLLGEAQVGKSSLVLRFVNGQFSPNSVATVGAAFLSKTMELGDTKIRYDNWDTAGQERFHSLTPMYYR